MKEVCAEFEQETGKGRLKWVDAEPRRRLAYLQQALSSPLLQGKLHYAVYRDSRDYTSLTVRTIAHTLYGVGAGGYEATVLIDALPRSLERKAGLQLRRSGIRAKKVRGVRKDENDALIRLADALCGFVRLAVEGNRAMQALLNTALANGFLKDVSPE